MRNVTTATATRRGARKSCSCRYVDTPARMRDASGRRASILNVEAANLGARERAQMLCRRCERRLWSPKLLRFWTSPRSVWGAGALGDLICVRCGTVLPPERVTERFLSRLSQLGQFGLAAAGRPLLEPHAEDD